MPRKFLVSDEIHEQDPANTIARSEVVKILAGSMQVGIPVGDVPAELSDMVVTRDYRPEIKTLEGERNLIEFIITTEVKDRDEDTIALDGWDNSAYVKNPVVLWAHDYMSLPVARSVDMSISGTIMHSVDEFTPADLYDFGHQVFRMIKEKFLNAVSVGFRPRKFTLHDGDFGIDWLEQEMLEHSVVPVPSNPEALVLARAKGLNVEPYVRWAKGASGIYVSEAISKLSEPVAEVRSVDYSHQLDGTDEAAWEGKVSDHVGLPVDSGITFHWSPSSEPVTQDAKTTVETWVQKLLVDTQALPVETEEDEDGENMKEITEALVKLNATLESFMQIVEHMDARVSALEKQPEAEAEPDNVIRIVGDPEQVIRIVDETDVNLAEVIEDAVHETLTATTGRLP